MDKTFTRIRCVAATAQIKPDADYTLQVNDNQRQLIFLHANIPYSINFEDIQSISLDEKATRSAGKAAAGAIIGGLLTGGIGLIAGAAIGGRKRDVTDIYLQVNINGHISSFILKPKENVQEVYAAICDAMAVPEAPGFNRVSRWTKK